MNYKLMLAACAVLVAVQTAVAEKGGPGGLKKGKELPKPTRGTLAAVVPRAEDSSEEIGGSSEEHLIATVEGERFAWNRVLSDIVSAHEFAFKPSGSSVLLVKSTDKILRTLNISGAVTVYDFSNDAKVEVVKVEGVCYVLEPALSYQEIVDQLNARNNTNVMSSDSIALNGTLPALTKEEVQALVLQFPALGKLCHKHSVIRTTSDVVDSLDTRTINFFTLNSRVSLRVIQPPPSQTPKGLLVTLRGGKSGEHKGH